MAARSDLRLAQLICARLCHDLAGLTGAIANGVDLVGETSSGADAEALALIGQSARQANARIAFFRVAFGANVPAQSLAEVALLAEGMLAGGAVRLAPRSGAAERLRLAPDGARLLLALVMVGAGSLPRGGAIRIDAAERAGGIEMTLQANGPGAFLKAEHLALLTGARAPETLSPRDIHAEWAGLLAGVMGGRVECTQGKDMIQLAALLPREGALG